MSFTLRFVLVLLLGIPAFLISLHTLIRILRHFYKFPMPEFAANLIDNPFRRMIQPPEEMPERLGIKEGMVVLEIGPGNGTYTMAAARSAGLSGKLISIDIEPKMIQRVQKRISQEGIRNVEARVADVFDLPFGDGYFDLVYMIAVIGEIPEAGKALGEFHRVLKPGGKLAFSEILLDPDYPRIGKLISLALSAGFQLEGKDESFLTYSIRFRKGAA